MSSEIKHLRMNEVRRAALLVILLQCDENVKSEHIVTPKSDTLEHWLMLMLLK